MTFWSQTLGEKGSIPICLPQSDFIETRQPFESLYMTLCDFFFVDAELEIEMSICNVEEGVVHN